MNKNKPIYIVTGCAGFIGYHVCESLLKSTNNIPLKTMDKAIKTSEKNFLV